MEVIIGADHGGFALKERIKSHLNATGIAVEDKGTAGEHSVDYPDFAVKVAEAVAESNGGSFGILCCGTGIGMSIAANKVRGIYAAQVNTAEEAKLSREHNNANILCLGGRVLSEEEALQIVDAFLTTPFSNEERHARRIDKIRELEK